MRTKLTALRDRLLATQKEMIYASAEVPTIPSDNALRKIADLEVAIGAVEALLEQSK